METPMEVEHLTPSMTSAACFIRGCIDMNQSGKVAMEHSCGLVCDEEASLPDEDGSKQLNEDTANQDTLVEVMYDKTGRRSSLGADSLFDQDFTEEGSIDCEVGSGLSAVENLLGLQYCDDVYNMKKELETKYHSTNCMADQPQVTEYMRCTLVHWLIKVNYQLQFGRETVFLAVNISDRFLSLTPLAQDCLQLLAVSSLFVAAKMEESVAPGISELVAMCGGTYKPHHFRLMEILILSTLEFVLNGPTSWYFIEYLILKASLLSPFDRRLVNVAKYVLETCLSDYEISQFLPSVQAAGALLMSLNAVQCSPVHLETLDGLVKELYTETERQDLTICSSLMNRYMAPFLSCLEAGEEPSQLCTLVDNEPKTQDERESVTYSQPPPGGSTDYNSRQSAAADIKLS